MAETIRVGIIGAGWPGTAHAKGYQAAGGFKVVAVADLIPSRRKALRDELGIAREYASADELLAGEPLEAVSVCLPTHLHAPVACSALRAGRHVMCEKPPALDAAEARQMHNAAVKAGKVLMYALQRRFGPAEQAARMAIDKGYVGEAYHARAVWTRTRGIPRGTGWFTHKEKSGGGALIDIGVHMLDIAWNLLGQPRPASAFGITHSRFRSLLADDATYDVEDAAFALLRFDGGKSIELAATWAINQPPTQNGTVCRIYGTSGAIEVYTPAGPVLYRDFAADGTCRQNPLKTPRLAGHAALMRHFRDCIHGKATPSAGAAQGVTLMQMIDGIYRSSRSGKSVKL